MYTKEVFLILCHHFSFWFLLLKSGKLQSAVIGPKSIILSEIDHTHSKVSFICFLHAYCLLIQNQYSYSVSCGSISVWD